MHVPDISGPSPPHMVRYRTQENKLHRKRTQEQEGPCFSLYFTHNQTKPVYRNSIYQIRKQQISQNNTSLRKFLCWDTFLVWHFPHHIHQRNVWILISFFFCSNEIRVWWQIDKTLLLHLQFLINKGTLNNQYSVIMTHFLLLFRLLLSIEEVIVFKSFSPSASQAHAGFNGVDWRPHYGRYIKD